MMRLRMRRVNRDRKRRQGRGKKGEGKGRWCEDERGIYIGMNQRGKMRDCRRKTRLE